MRNALSPVFCLVGPTAVGKTEIAARVLEKLNGRAVSADARQVYKFLDIGTDKPPADLRHRVGFEMLDVVSPEESYSAADYARDARQVIARLLADGTPFMLVGGSGLYLRALFAPFFAAPHVGAGLRESFARVSSPNLHDQLREIDPQSAARLHPNDRQRIVRALEVFEATGRPMSELQHSAARQSEFIPTYVGLELPRSLLNERIDARFDRMIAEDLADEVRQLTKMGYGESTPALNAIGYREILGFIDGKWTLDAAIAVVKKRSRAYAKRQMTWFRHQDGITWIDAQDIVRATSEVERRFLDFLKERHRM
jgi:tRNA dimethylallyltransferase